MSDDRVVGDVRRIFGDVEALAQRLRTTPSGPAMQPVAVGETRIAAATRRERARIVGRGVDGLAKIADGRERDLHADERLGLRAIILLEGRPAISSVKATSASRRRAGRALRSIASASVR
jgi:hypothetical protein